MINDNSNHIIKLLLIINNAYVIRLIINKTDFKQLNWLLELGWLVAGWLGWLVAGWLAAGCKGW